MALSKSQIIQILNTLMTIAEDIARKENEISQIEVNKINKINSTGFGFQGKKYADMYTRLYNEKSAIMENCRSIVEQAQMLLGELSKINENDLSSFNSEIYKQSVAKILTSINFIAGYTNKDDKIESELVRSESEMSDTIENIRKTLALFDSTNFILEDLKTQYKRLLNEKLVTILNSQKVNSLFYVRVYIFHSQFLMGFISVIKDASKLESILRALISIDYSSYFGDNGRLISDIESKFSKYLLGFSLSYDELIDNNNATTNKQNFNQSQNLPANEEELRVELEKFKPILSVIYNNIGKLRVENLDQIGVSLNALVDFLYKSRGLLDSKVIGNIIVARNIFLGNLRVYITSKENRKSLIQGNMQSSLNAIINNLDILISNLSKKN